MKEIHQKELERIRLKNGGILNPRDVVNEAESPENPLHECFCWDDKIAARNYRLEQARQMIRVCVTIFAKSSEPIRAYVSLAPDRIDGGYRALADVMSDETMRNQLMSQAKRDMKTFEQKYSQLDELAEVFEAMRSVE